MVLSKSSRVATAAGAAAAVGTVCLGGRPFAAPAARGIASAPAREAAAATGAKEKDAATSMNTVIGVLELAFGAGVVLLSSGLFRARADPQRAPRVARRAVARRASVAVTADAAVAETFVENAPKEPGAFDITVQPGITAPYGEPGVSCWDPAGLADGIDAETFRWYRKAEIKHGRVCMLAIVGLLAQHSWRFDLAAPYKAAVYDFGSVPSGLGAAAEGSVASPFLGVIVLVAALVELNASDDGRDPGDFGDPLGFAKAYGLDFEGEDSKEMWQNFEINHGRLAMSAFLGTVLAEYATGLDAVEQWGYAGAAFKRTFAITIPQGEVASLASFQ